MRANVNKLIFSCLCVLLLQSCIEPFFENTQTRKYRHVVNYQINNSTNADLYCEIVQTTVFNTSESLSKYIMPNETNSIIFDGYRILEMYINFRAYYSSVSDIIIYNLSDTTQLFLVPIIQQYIQQSSIWENDWIIRNNSDSKYNYGDPFCWMLDTYILSISGEKLSLFQKDNSMLEKFPEYYEN